MRALVLVVCLWLLAGCGPRGERVASLIEVAGTEDVELTYEADAAARPRAATEDLRALVLQRLGAAQIGADVTQHDRRVSIIVDEALGPLVDELVTWTGTLLVLDPDPDYLLSPRPQFAPRTDGMEHWFEGGRGELLRAAEVWSTDREHRILVEPTYDAENHWRTRVVHAVPVGELGEGALVGWGSGATLRVRGTPDTLAAAVIHHAAERPVRPVVARGRISLGRPAFEGERAIALSFGSGAEAYARVQRERHLLTTARLPPLRRIDAVGLPPNRILGAACFAVPVLVSLGWLAFVRRFDRAHPEPRWLIATTFLLGAMSTVPAGLLEYAFARLSPWLDPNLITFGGQTFALPLAFAVFTVVVGLSEEGSKRLAAQFAVRRPEFDEPVDGIVYGIVASLGFAAAENIRYFAIGRLTAPLVIARCFMSVPAHMFFGALWGYALGARLVDPRKRVWGWLALAAACHGLFDALLSTEGAGGLAVLLNLVLASVFVVLVRRALRHGIVTKDMVAIQPETRALFRVGRPGLFWLSAACLHVLALGIFVLGAYYQLARHRPSVLFVGGSSVMLALLAVAALGVSSTLPLDVAIDAHGVTFAGATRSWRKIRGFTLQQDHVELACEAGPIQLGPAEPRTLAAIAGELESRLGKAGDARVLTLDSPRQAVNPRSRGSGR